MLMRHKEWYELLSIPVPDDIRDLVLKCKKLNSELQLIRLCLKNRIRPPNDYLITVRTMMLGILTSWLSFLKQFVKDPEEIKTIEKELIELQSGLATKETEIGKELGSRDKYFFNMQLYLNIYYEFLYSYIFNTLKEAEQEYAKGLRKEIAAIMLRKVGILKIVPPPEEERKIPIKIQEKPKVEEKIE